MRRFVLMVVLMLAGCTQNERAKNWGGDMTVKLPARKKLVNATWKNDALWYLVRDMRDGESAETIEFREESPFGMMQGTVTFKESP